LTAPHSVKEYSKPSKLDTNIVCIYLEKRGTICVGNVLTGKQMNKGTKLRFHNITAKAALKFGSEAWVLKKREEQRLEAAQMKFLRH